MHHASPRRAKGTIHRSPRPSISPYFIEEIGLTIADVQRARTADFEPASVASR
jgi:hypothetical protein